MPRSVTSSRIRPRICFCTVTSSAVVGSSAISTSGSQASAMAIMMRWRCPPENWCGKLSTRRAASGMPTRSSRVMAFSRAALLDRFWCRRSGSAICAPTRCTGFSAVIGSWKIIATW